jgi:glycine hydroxymethyltransferase
MTKLNKYMSNNYQDFFDKNLSLSDPELYSSIKHEFERQQEHIELIASENIVSKAVLDAQGSIMTNKYAEDIHLKGITVDVNLLIKRKIWL